MQNKGFVKVFALLLALNKLYKYFLMNQPQPFQDNQKDMKQNDGHFLHYD